MVGVGEVCVNSNKGSLTTDDISIVPEYWMYFPSIEHSQLLFATWCSDICSPPLLTLDDRRGLL